MPLRGVTPPIICLPALAIERHRHRADGRPLRQRASDPLPEMTRRAAGRLADPGDGLLQKIQDHRIAPQGRLYGPRRAARVLAGEGVADERAQALAAARQPDMHILAAALVQAIDEVGAAGTVSRRP